MSDEQQPPDTLAEAQPIRFDADDYARTPGVSPARFKRGVALLRLRGWLKRVPSAAELESGELGAPGNVLALRPKE